MPDMTPQDVLLKAADIIHERGWCKNALETDDGRVCLAGAIQRAAGAQFIRDTGMNADFDPNGDAWLITWPSDERKTACHGAMDLVHLYLWSMDGSTRLRMDMWNDQHAKSADEVIEVLKRASEQKLGSTI